MPPLHAILEEKIQLHNLSERLFLNRWQEITLHHISFQLLADENSSRHTEEALSTPGRG